MRTLFVHQSFPGQYCHLAAAQAARPGHEVVALGEQALGGVPGVRQLRYPAPDAAGRATHPYVQPLEAAVRRGQAVARACLTLKAQGFLPDLICCHPGWGEGLFLREAFPAARLLFYFEYHYAAEGGDVGFGEPVSLDEAARLRLRNANHLLSLDAADWGHTATHWQHSRFPAWARARISVQHEGVDTDRIQRDPAARFPLPDGRTLDAEAEVVTYVARGLEPYRGFPSFMRALPAILRARPRAQIVIVGEDQAHYGAPPAAGGSWREAMLRELGDRLDTQRLHFVGRLPHPDLLALFSISAAHVYLTCPFILSWSVLEAMACACPIVASATAPVQEVLHHGETARLVDFFAPAELAEAVIATLTDRARARVMGLAARHTVVRDYDLSRRCLPAGLALLDRVASG